MSYDFFGRPINSGKNAYRIEICEICVQKSSEWIEVIGNKEDGFIFRFSCSNCHSEFNKIPVKEELYSREIKSEDSITKSIRDGWIDDFIKNGTESENNEYSNNTEKSKNEDNWVKDFIDEALFGSDPVNWMESRNLFDGKNIISVINSLGQLSLNELSSVKLASIRCLNIIYTKNNNLKNEIILQLDKFSNDINEIVVNFCNEVIAAISK